MRTRTADKMSVGTYLHRFVVSNALTVYYSVLTLFIFAYNYIKNPFADPWALRLKLEPPAPLSDPKYGLHRYVKVNNVMLHYVESGDSTKPLMLFVHGFPEFWYSWRHQIVEFKKDYWCVAVDMRGYADSEKLEGVSPYKLQLLVEDIRDLLRHLGREKCILVAHDWGGLIASRFRDVHPESLSAIVILASTSREAWFKELWDNPEQRSKSWYVFLYRTPMLAESLLQMNNLVALDQAMMVPGKESITKEDLECYKYWFRKQNALTPPLNYYRANFEYSLPEKKHCETNIPFLAAHAANDPYLNHSLLDAMKKEYKHLETAIVDSCGHFLQQEEPGKVNKLIRDFLGKHNL